MATMVGNYNDGSSAGKVQFGAAAGGSSIRKMG